MSLETYFPAMDNWATKKPEEVSMDSGILEEAISMAEKDAVADYPPGVDIYEYKAEELRNFTKGLDDGKIIGPLIRKGTVNGLVIRHGYIVAEFGDTSQTDELASASKSFIATIAGLAKEDGLIGDFSDPVKDYISDWKFESEHNSKITWRQLLQQTSEWEGTLWGKSDETCRAKGRELQEPGSIWEYNDVRVNCLALCLMQLYKQTLPQILHERIMNPIGASDAWQWHGYDNSDIEIDGRILKSVTGGAHWGGGIWMNSRDFARYGYLHLRRGNWNGNQLFRQDFIDEIISPCKALENPIYGYLWWIQPDKEGSMLSYGAEGGGYHICRVFPKYDLVTVVRWTGWDGFWNFNKRVVESIIK